MEETEFNKQLIDKFMSILESCTSIYVLGMDEPTVTPREAITAMKKLHDELSENIEILQNKLNIK